jgi:hypothetical protein
MRTSIVFLSVIILCFSGCLAPTDTKCCELVDSYVLEKGLYIEKYRTFCAGVFGELTDCYLTDSVSFRQSIGSYDEHEHFRAYLNGNKIETYNIVASLIEDTVAKKTIPKADLWKCHHTDSNCLKTVPIFGVNTITCDTNFYPASFYETEKGFFISEVQYKCGNDYSNAVFYTDTLNFSMFIGVTIPGSFENHYRVQKNKDNFDFYNITLKDRLDTVRTKTFLLADLKKGKLIQVCK